MAKKTKNVQVIRKPTSKKPEKKINFLEKITKFPFPYIIIIVLTFGVYFQTLFFGFINLDDDTIIKDNLVNVNNISVIKEVFLRDIFYTHDKPFYRPLLTLSLIFNKVTSGENLFYFHLTNLILNIILICLLFYFLKLLKINEQLSLLFSLIFAIHPLFVNAVVWLVARDGLLANVFLISSFVMLIKYENTKRRYYIILHLLFFTLALYSKEVALIAPLMYIIYLSKLKIREIIKRENLLLILCWTILIIPFWILRNNVIGSHENVSLSNILSNLPFIPEILCKFIIPIKLSGMPTFDFLLVMIGLIIALGIFIVFIINRKKSNYFYLLFGLIWVLVFSFPGMFTSYLKFGGNDYVENRAYLPMIGIAIFLGNILNSISLRKPSLNYIFIVICIVFGIINISYSRNYSQPIKFYNSVIEKGTKVALAYYNRGNLKNDVGDKEGVLRDYNQAIELRPDYEDAYINRGNLKKDLNDNEGAKNDYNRAIELNPDSTGAYNNRGVIKIELGDKEGAISDLNRAIEIKPYDALVYFNRGIVRNDLGDKKGAKQDYDRAIELQPGYAEVFYNRGILNYSIGDKEGAIRDYNRAIELKPDFADYYFDLGICYFSIKDYKKAISCFEKVIELNPKNADAIKNLGIAKRFLERNN